MNFGNATVMIPDSTPETRKEFSPVLGNKTRYLPSANSEEESEVSPKASSGDQVHIFTDMKKQTSVEIRRKITEDIKKEDKRISSPASHDDSRSLIITKSVKASPIRETKSTSTRHQNIDLKLHSLRS